MPAPVGQVRLRLVRAGDHTSYADLRGATACALVTGSRRDEIVAPARARPAAAGRRPRPGLAPDLAQPTRRSATC